MESKKNPDVNLEKHKRTLVFAGFVVAIGACIMFFNWTTSAKDIKVTEYSQIEIIDDQVANTVQEKVTPPKIQQVKSFDVIQIVEKQIEINNEYDPIDTDIDETDVIQLVDIETEPEDSGEIIYIAVEEFPAYPGGDLALSKWLAKEIKYPRDAIEFGIQGTVYVKFVVSKKGTIENVSVLKGVDPILDEEAIRVVKAIKGFSPGKQSGQPVSVWFTLPIKFKLN